MAVYSYHARTLEGQNVSGNISADTARQARDELRRRGLEVRRMATENAAKKTSFGQTPFGRVSSAQLTSATRELATLLAVGIPLTESLDTLCEQHSGKFKTALLLVRDRVAQGASLATAMSEQPHVFDEVSRRMVEVGENSGTLDVVLEELANFKEQSVQLKDRVLTSLLYPMFVLLLSLGVCVFLMTVVVPMLLTNLLDAGKELPWPTKVLKSVSDFLVYNGWWASIVTAVGIFVSVVASRVEPTKSMWHGFLLRLPILGSLLTKQAIARVSFVLSTLMRSGIVYLDALDFAAKATNNVIVRRALQESGKAVQSGSEISTALKSANVVPPLVVHVFAVGQQSGRLEEMLQRLSQTYDREVTLASTRLASILEPALIVTLALFVGFILFATMLPILEAGNVL